MLYNCVRVEALCAMRLGDFVDSPEGGAYLLALEKGGKSRKLPAHHVVVEALRRYLELAGLRDADKKAPLFKRGFRVRRPIRSGPPGGMKPRRAGISGPSWSLPQATKHANDNHDGHP